MAGKEETQRPGLTTLTVVVGAGDAAREVAVLHREGGEPGLFWCGGFGSDMRGTKATHLDGFAAETGLAVTRFDYSGHGASAGRFQDGTITQWLADARAVFDRMATQPQIVVGSSMGGWIALLLAASLVGSGRVAGLVLLAPAFDMTRDLMWQRMDEEERVVLTERGVITIPESGLPITRALIEDGERHLFGDRLIDVGCPVTIIQSIKDAEVPYQHAERLVSRLASDDVVFTLVKDGDHRLSRPEDLALLTAAVSRMVTDFNAAPRQP